MNQNENNQPVPSAGPASLLAFQTLIVFLIAFIFMHHLLFKSPYMAGVDAYYHIKFSYITRTEGLIGNFPWAHLSWWRDNFADKSFLYHVFLIPFTFFDNLAEGAKWSSVLVSALVLSSFYLILRLNHIKFAFIWFLALTATGNLFMFRIGLTRPQGLSVFFALWTLHFLINDKKKQLAAVCFIYALTYTILLPFVLALCKSLAHFFVYRRIEWRCPAICLGALAAAMVFNPYFPDNVIWFVFPNFYILLMGSFSHTQLGMGSEFAPSKTNKLITICSSVVIPYFTAFFLALFSPRKANEKILSLFIASVGLIILTLLMKRFGEYSIPVTLFFAAAFLNGYYTDKDLFLLFRKYYLRGAAAVLVLTAALAACHISSYRNLTGYFNSRKPKLKDAALYVAHNADPGEVVFTCDWDDAPQLFYFNHSNRYLVFLDPTFIYAWDPELWREWSLLAHGNFSLDTYDKLKKYGRYGICTSDFKTLYGIIRVDDRIDIVYEDPNFYVFKIKT
jgi:hypothetical protein